MNTAQRTSNLLQRLADGDSTAGDDLLPLLYGELHELARRYMAKERRQHTLQPTALINEAWMRLVGGEKQDWKNRNHFVAAAARAMRRVLIDAARRKKSDKRGGDRTPLPLEAAVDQGTVGDADLA